VNDAYLCVHGHFYQPPREDPFTGKLPREPEAKPYHDYNEKVTAECYQPNAERGNFARMSFDLGPTLAAWMAARAPATLRAIQAAEREHVRTHGASNALALPYSHTILPLAGEHEKRIQVAWGVADYTFRYGHAPEGAWLPEAAVDLASLRALADAGIAYTILAPWQADGPIDTGKPHWVELGAGRRIAVFFYHAALSGGVSFDSDLTVNADRFARESLAPLQATETSERGAPRLTLIASDGELYGHHQPWRDQFLAQLLQVSAPSIGWRITTLGVYLREHPPLTAVTIRPRTAWSCPHSLARWSAGCPCTVGDSSWKRPLRAAFDGLAARLDALYEQRAGRLLSDPWETLAGYLGVRLGREPLSAMLSRAGAAAPASTVRSLRRWLELQYFRQLMLTSCGYFFEDLDRIEPRNNIACAARAISLLPSPWRRTLEAEFVAAIGQARSWRTGRTGADLYSAAAPPPPHRTRRAVDVAA